MSLGGKVGYVGHTLYGLVKHWDGVFRVADLFGAGMSARCCLLH